MEYTVVLDNSTSPSTVISIDPVNIEITVQTEDWVVVHYASLALMLSGFGSIGIDTEAGFVLIVSSLV